MADLFFPNVMPDFVAESTVISAEAQDSLMELLSMPYHSLSERFKRAALDLKETVPILFVSVPFALSLFFAYQVYVVLFQIVMETWGMTGQHVRDFTLYCGTLGTAFLLFKAYLVTSNKNDLALCSQIVKACDSASFSPTYSLSLSLSLSLTLLLCRYPRMYVSWVWMKLVRCSHW
jgi:hypothetical protein